MVENAYNGEGRRVVKTVNGAATYYLYEYDQVILETNVLGDVSNSVLFAGYQYDKETGLYYLNARMYDPVTARFMQEDTFAGQQSDPLSLNLYTYCHNSPLLYFDPTGHYPQTSEGIQAEIDQLYETGTHNAGLWSQINALEAERDRAYKREYPGRPPNNPAENAMINAGAGGDTFKFPPMVYKTDYMKSSGK